MDVWNYILGYRNTLKSVFGTWVVHIPFNRLQYLANLVKKKHLTHRITVFAKFEVLLLVLLLTRSG